MVFVSSTCREEDAVATFAVATRPAYATLLAYNSNLATERFKVLRVALSGLYFRFPGIRVAVPRLAGLDEGEDNHMDGGGSGFPGASPDAFWGELKALLRKYPPAGRRSKLLGILITRPSLEIFKKEIEPQWDWFHLRSGQNFHIVTLGYGDITDRVANKSFSNEWLEAGISSLQQRTDWRYSGESDLLLCNVEYEKTGGVYLRISEAMCITIEAAIKDGLITSFSNLLERIREYINSYQDKDILWGFSDHIAKRSIAEAMRLLVYSFLPEAIRAKAKGLEHAAVKKIGHHHRSLASPHQHDARHHA